MSLEIAKAFLEETRMCDRAMYADDYTTTFPGGVVLHADMVCATVKAIIAAGPDFSFNVEDLREVDGTVTGKVNVTTTMTREFSHPQFGTIPPTGKRAVLDVEHFTLRFKDGKVASMVVRTDSPTGPPEVIRQWTA
jgi:hypothetical protein